MLAARAHDYGFSLAILRVALCMYRSPRVIKVGSACSSPIQLASTIVAGCTFATTLLKVLIIRAMDATAALHNAVRINVNVDDARLQARGRGGSSADLVAAAAPCLIDELQKPQVGLVVSMPKSHGVAATPSLRSKLGAELKKKGMAVKARTRNLGIDFTSGGRRRTGVRQERFQKLRKRLHRFAALSTGSSHAPAAVFRAGGVASTIHGVEVTGMADSSVARLRRMTGYVLFTRASGRSLTASYLLSAQRRDDPMFDVTAAPMVAWASAVWTATSEQDIRDMRIAFSRALTKVARAVNPFACATGPAVATLATLRRIGWTAVSYWLWFDNHRNLIDLREVCLCVCVCMCVCVCRS